VEKQQQSRTLSVERRPGQDMGIGVNTAIPIAVDAAVTPKRTKPPIRRQGAGFRDGKTGLILPEQDLLLRAAPPEQAVFLLSRAGKNWARAGQGVAPPEMARPVGRGAGPQRTRSNSIVPLPADYPAKLGFA
jgi:hypothetical protein